jgi:hypothetical protein
MRSAWAAAIVAALTAPAAADDWDDEDGDDGGAPSMMEDDVTPSMTVVERDDVSLTFGGLLQMHVAPYVGRDSLLADDDPASRAGLRMRRARLGFLAHLPSHVSVLLVTSPLESDEETGSIADARITYARHRWARISVGADKVPFTRGELQSSAALASIERPLGVVTLVPQRRLGFTVEGGARRGGYVAGVMNATEGYELGNQFSGLLYVARGEVAVLGRREGGDGAAIVLGGGGYFEDGAASRVAAASVDIGVTVGNTTARIEALCDRRMPLEMPELSPELAGEITRCDGYVEASHRLRDVHGELDVEPAVRAEWLDDNLDLDDAGDAFLVSAGANAQVTDNLRAQLHYLGRFERKSQERANDAVIMNVQGQF